MRIGQEVSKGGDKGMKLLTIMAIILAATFGPIVLVVVNWWLRRGEIKE